MADAPEAPVTPEVKSEEQTFSNEIWKSLPPPDNDYQISNMGRFRSHIKHGHRDYLPTFGHDNGMGYRFVKFMSQGKRATRYIHRLVAEAFISNPENKPHINHLDGDKNNNRVDNLEWVTPQENEEHKRNFLGVSRNSDMVPVTCVETGNSFYCMREAARQYNICCKSIERVIKGQQLTAGGYHWRRKENS